MKSKNKSKKSIFPEDMLKSIIAPSGENNLNVFDEIEILSAKVDESGQNAALLRNKMLESNQEARTMADLVKMSCKLPEVDTPEKMLSNSSESKVPETERRDNDSPYRMINLISENFRLPDIEEENMLR